LTLILHDVFLSLFPDKNAKTDNSKRGDPNDPRVRLKRDCVGLLAAFKLSDPCDHILIVANTHIYWQVKQKILLSLEYAFTNWIFLLCLVLAILVDSCPANV